MIEVYPVGALAALRTLYRAYTTEDPDRAIRTDIRRYARARLTWEAKTLAARVRRREWRAAKNTFNGYLAEPTPFPDGMTRCGSGWTRRRAIRSLYRHGHPEPRPASWHNDQPRYRHTHPCPARLTDGWGGPLHADPNAPGHDWYECPHPHHAAT